MNRQLNILEFALSGLLRRWKKNLTLLLVFTLIVTFFSSVLFLSHGLHNQAQRMLKKSPHVWVQKIAGGRLEPIPLALADTLKMMPGVRKIQPRIWGYYYDSPTDAIFTIMGNGTQTVNNRRMSLAGDSAIVGSGFARLRQLETGDRFVLQDPLARLHGFNIKAKLDPSTDLISRDLIVLPPDSAALVLGMPPASATDLAIILFNEQESTNLARKISRIIPGVRVSTRQQLLRTYTYLFSWRGGLLYFGGLLSLFAFLLLVWDKASGLSAEEKRELGILKGMGWQVDDILWLRFWEAIVIAVSAVLTGVLLAIVHIYVADAALLKPMFAGWSALYPSYRLPLNVSAGDVVLILLIAVVPYLAANLFPAWRAAVTSVDRLLQNQ